MKILFVHLLNNFTGSPRVLANFLKEYSLDKSNDVHLLTSSSYGCLSQIKNIKYHRNCYKWVNNKFILTMLLLISQMYQFFFVLFGKKYDCVYINTILPFGAAIAAKLRKEKVIYHVHEYYPIPNIMQRGCVYFVNKKANKIIFVSQYLANCYKDNFIGIEKEIIPNSVSNDFIRASLKYIEDKNYIRQKYKNKEIVLPCALKKNKGVSLFLELSKLLPEYNFTLVTSNSREETSLYFTGEKIPPNFNIQNEVKDMTEIYKNASIVVNLSLPHGTDICIETFSMVLIEAFAFKTPCIAPCYGGPLEIIQNEKNGYLLEIENLSEVAQKIKEILNDFDRYKLYCEQALVRFKDFSVIKFCNAIENVINGV